MLKIKYLFPFKDDAQRFLRIVCKHCVNVLAGFGFGGVGNQIFDGQFALGHKCENKVAVAFSGPGVIDVLVVGRFGLVCAKHCDFT